MRRTRYRWMAMLLAVFWWAACNGDNMSAAGDMSVAPADLTPSCDVDLKTSVCCCNFSDALGEVVCAGGQWTCKAPFQLYSGNVCLGMGCGGPCGWPCFDMAAPKG